MLACGLGVGLTRWWSERRAPSDAATLVQALPEDRSVHLFVDLGMLREAGFLDFFTGAKTPEEPDYRKFVDDTGFDYRLDLDAVAAAFSGGNLYLTARGQFEWSRLTAYAQAQGGQCQNSICQMPATRPDRSISFYPLRRNVLALAVAAEPRGVIMISPGHWRVPPDIPAVPVWVSAPPAKLADVSSLPSGSRSFLSPLSQTRGAVFTLGPTSPSTEAGFELRLRAATDSAAVAADIAGQLTATTDLLRKMLVRDNLKAAPADLTSVLTSGRFVANNNDLSGVWSIDRRFLDKLLSGQVE